MPFITPDATWLAEIMAEYDLPDLPDNTDDDDTEARDLILYTQDLIAPNYYLIERVTLGDARRYVNREDTHGEGWFVGFDRS